MTDIAVLIAHHGYLVLSLVVLAESIGLPMPAALALVAAGAAVASHLLRAPAALIVAITSMLLGDLFLYIMGRYTGWALLGFLCRVSINPETCILRAAESFYKRGRLTLVIAKFLPGINTMAPPLAGSMRMRFPQFLALDVLGATLYVFAYGTVGYVFRDFVAAITRGLRAAGLIVEIVILVALAGYVIYRIRLYRRHRIYRFVPRVQVAELAQKLASEEAERILLVDVRSHGYYDPGAARIKGSIRIEPNNLSEEIKLLPQDKDIYVYCT